MDPGQSTIEKQTKRSRAYFFVSILFLIAMTLTWHLDAFFVYIFLGAAIFFLFLSYWKKRATPPGDPENKSFRNPAGKGTRHHRRTSLLQDLFQRQKPFSTQKQQNQKQQPQGKFVLTILGFIIFIFFITIISAIFSDDETYSYDAINYYQTAEQFRINELYDSADHYYQLAISTESEYAEAFTGYGNSLLARNKYDQAISNYDKALEINPGYQAARYNKSYAYYSQKNYRQSLQETFRLLRSDPEYYDAVVLAGDNYYADQNYDSALYWYQEGYDNGVRSAWLCHVMGYLYDTKGDTEKAVDLYKEALSYDSNKVDVYLRLGEIYPGQEGEQYRTLAQQLKSAGY